MAEPGSVAGAASEVEAPMNIPYEKQDRSGSNQSLLRYNRGTPMPIRLACLALLFALCASAPAREVYKCTNAQGDVAFQDKPCARGTTELTVHVAEESEYAPPPAPPVAESAAPPPPPPQPARLKPPLKPLPPLWLCMNAEDGSRYISRNGAPPPRLVPLGVLGYPPKTLSEAYAPGATNRMSAPEMSKTPIDTSPRGSIAAGYTQVQDECVTLNPEQSCDVLHQQHDQLSDKLGHARFKDEQARLGAEIDDIESDLGGCPN